MNTRTGELAADVAFETPPAIPVALIFGYNGAAIKTRAQVDAWGRPFVMGFESSTTRSYAGGDAGEADSAFSCGVFDSWGYPRECGSWVCAADDPNTPSQFLANCEEYGYRYGLRQMVGGRFGPITAYGNPAVVNAVCRGIRRAGLVALRWGVGTWGYGEGGGPNQPPDQADVDVLQSGNGPAPAPFTDLDWLYVPVATFAALGGPAPKPKFQEDGMEVIVSQDPGGSGDNFAVLCQGSTVLEGPVQDSAVNSYLGIIPNSAAVWQPRQAGGVRVGITTQAGMLRLIRPTTNTASGEPVVVVGGGGVAGPQKFDGVFSGQSTPI